MSKKVLLIAFDGLDRDLVEEFGCDNLIQEEHNGIDNDSGMSKRVTSELFASLITGKTYEKHGIKGLDFWTNKWVNKIEDNFGDTKPFKKTVSARSSFWEFLDSTNIVSIEKKIYNKEDLESETLFDKLENSRAMFVPSYNPSPTWQGEAAFLPLKLGFDKKYVVEEWWKHREFNYRKEKLFRELDSDILGPRDFLMCHFHRPDIEQHLYADKELGITDRDKLLDTYNQLDKFAAEIIEKAPAKGYDTVIFMSDHGIPTEEGHNKNAFYSCNHELFGDKTPHITDFHDKILELVEE